MLPALQFRVQLSNWFHGPRPVSKLVATWWPKESGVEALSGPLSRTSCSQMALGRHWLSHPEWLCPCLLSWTSPSVF